MRAVLLFLIFLFTCAPGAQAPSAVPVVNEPHHHQVLKNSYVSVLRVSIPGKSATLLHRHDFPYVYVSLGAADIINAMAGRPEAHVVLTDGQVGFLPAISPTSRARMQAVPSTM